MSEDDITLDTLTRVSPVGYHAGDCGYCKDEETGASYYVTTQYLLPNHYQVLMDRGWRRSGSLLYLPDGLRSCCPHYTIRLPATEFNPSRDQRQALHRWNRYVLGDKYLEQVDKRHPVTKEQKKATASKFDLHETLHKSEQHRLPPGIDPAHRFQVTLEPDDYTEEKYRLYEHYQQIVHKEQPEEISKAGFKRFLCSSPIQRQHDPTGRSYGSYHQCYRLDGCLFAMGVVDLLPHAVSGVYFIYHNDFEKFSLGKLSALREAGLAGESGYDYYYMGYYIHDCEKMKYKATYRPQYILDVQTHSWNLLDDDMKSLMSNTKFVSMSVEQKRPRPENNEPEPVDVEDGQVTGKTTESATDQPKRPPKALSDDFGCDPCTAQEALQSGKSLLEIGMPGIMTLDQIAEQVNLDEMKVLLGRSALHYLSDLTTWQSGSETVATSLKGMAAELAACIGPDLVDEIVIDFSR